jgi:NADH-quinone oxidoreductase subunit F
MNDRNEQEILVCCGTGCAAHGSLLVVEALNKALSGAGLAVPVKALAKKTGCNGFCENGPIVRIMPQDTSYYRVCKEDAADIVAALSNGTAVERLLYTDEAGKKAHTQRENPFYAQQHKIALRNAGLIDPADIEDSIRRGAYEGLKKALTMGGDAIIGELEKSGLRGRGGAGFPTGRKWRECARYDDFPKYVVCNGDEGDPGAFMDRSILEGDPHSVIEGLAIAALAVGARVFLPAGNGGNVPGTMISPNMWSATGTRATRGPSWIARYWKETPIASSKGLQSRPSRWARGKALCTSGTSTASP